MGNTEIIKPLMSGHIFESYLQRLFHNFLFLLSGFNWDQVDETRLKVYHSHPFGDFSFKNLTHFIQIYFAGKLVKFDYGKEKNLKLYGQATPLEYDLKQVTCKQICLLHGGNDWLAADADLDFLRSELRVPLVEDYRVPVDDWNHLDFILAKDCGKYVNRKVLDILDKYWMDRDEEDDDQDVSVSMSSSGYVSPGLLPTSGRSLLCDQ